MPSPEPGTPRDGATWSSSRLAFGLVPGGPGQPLWIRALSPCRPSAVLERCDQPDRRISAGPVRQAGGRGARVGARSPWSACRSCRRGGSTATSWPMSSCGCTWRSRRSATPRSSPWRRRRPWRRCSTACPVVAAILETRRRARRSGRRRRSLILLIDRRPRVSGWAGSTTRNGPFARSPTLNHQPTATRLFHEQDWGGLIAAECQPGGGRTSTTASSSSARRRSSNMSTS